MCLCRRKPLQSEVVFKWRHFGKYTGVFTDKHGKKYKGNGKMLSDLTELNIRLDVIGQASILSIMKKGLKR